MATYGFMVPILPGKTEQNQRFADAMRGPRRAEYEASRRRLGLRVEQVWRQSTPHGDFSVVYLEADDLARVFAGLGTSDDPFDRWWREQILEIHGIDLTQPLPGPWNELLLDWRDA